MADQEEKRSLAFQADSAGFDHLAQHYDQDYTQTRVGLWLRERTHALLDARFGPGSHVMELGCGTGEDTAHLVRRGVRVTATDYSAGMLDAARAKLGAGTSALAEFAQLDLGALPPDGLPGPFDGAFSNFGPLNCLDGWRPLARWLADRIRPGGIAALCVMGPLCVWEMGWYGLHGEFGVALRRFRKKSVFQVEGGESIQVRYPTAARLWRDFAPWFRVASQRGIGVFLPPVEQYGLLDRRPGVFQRLTGWETRLADHWPFLYLGDHYWLELERTTDARL